MSRQARPTAVSRTAQLAAAALIGLVLAAIALTGSGSATAPGTVIDTHTFGAEPLWVALRGPLATTLDPVNLNAELGLESRLRALPQVSSVLGPATYLSQTAAEVRQLIAADVAAQGGSATAQAKATASLLVRYGYIGMPSLSNQSFVGGLIFGSGTSPLSQFRWLFPSARSALIKVRPRAGLPARAIIALRQQINRLLAQAGLSGVSAGFAPVQQLRLYVSGASVTAPAVLRWMARVDQRAVALDAGVRPGPDLASLLAGGLGQSIPTRAELAALATLVPRTLLSDVLTTGGAATEMSFTMPAADAALTNRIEQLATGPPAGISVRPAGAAADGAGG